MKIADRILNLRKTKGISQEELADIIGVSRQAVSKWESDQSIPEIDKVIIMSDYFNVSTDYILKGDTLKKQEENKNNSVSKILYIASTAFIAIGLLCAFASWYNEKTVETIWGSMIIQVVGIVGYFIGKSISKEKAHIIIDWLNIILTLFMPISLIVTVALDKAISPYPSNLVSIFVFSGVYLVIMATVFLVLKKYNKIRKNANENKN